MAITSKTRKILWVKSGNRCAICKNTLVKKVDNLNPNFIVGEECHIISSKEKGPRGKLNDLQDFDAYENLILLCANDHKLVDECTDKFTFEILTSIKDNHEKWINEAIEKDWSARVNDHNNAVALDEILHHKMLDIILTNAHFHYFDVNEIGDDKQAIEIGELFDCLREYSDFYSVIESSQRIKYLIEYFTTMVSFRNSGVRFFGKKIIKQFEFMGTSKSNYEIAIIVGFQRTGNDDPIRNGKLLVRIPEDFNPTF